MTSHPTNLMPFLGNWAARTGSVTGTDWSSDDRVMWLQMISMAFQMAYGQKEPIKITKDAAN
jgi:hypothetical protein